MNRLTTAQLAVALGVADSTIRYYRSTGRIHPSGQTPGGHARYELEAVQASLGISAQPSPGESFVTGIEHDSFAPLGEHDVSARGDSPQLPADIAALRMGESNDDQPARSARWGGRLMNGRRAVAA